MVVSSTKLGLGGTVVLQSTGADQAGEAVCETGFGDLIVIGLGLVTIFLVMLAVYRGTLAFNKYGSPRTEKKREGQEQLKGAGITLMGAFMPGIFATILDQVGLVTLSCVDLGNVLVTMPVLF